MNRSRGLTLGDLELATLEAIWRLGEADVRRVHADVGVVRKLTSNTIQSTLDRLYRKDLLRRRKVSHAFVYSAAIDRAGLVARTIDAVIGQLGHGETGTALTAFVDFAVRSDPGALNELERLIAERKNAAVADGKC
jgi:predicted transcriptional regulator